MSVVSNEIPRIVIRSIAGGLLLMTLFTMMWAGIATAGLAGSDHKTVLIFFSVLGILFIGYAIHLFVISKRFPKIISDEQKAEGKKIGKWYGIIFGLEGVTIPAVVFILIAMHLDKLVVPAIALIVGLHFYPMANVFKRKVDYYLATWTCIVAIIAIIMTVENAALQTTVFAFLGIGVALATSSYGLYMIREGNKLTKPYR